MKWTSHHFPWNTPPVSTARNGGGEGICLTHQHFRCCYTSPSNVMSYIVRQKEHGPLDSTGST